MEENGFVESFDGVRKVQELEGQVGRGQLGRADDEFLYSVSAVSDRRMRRRRFLLTKRVIRRGR